MNSTRKAARNAGSLFLAAMFASLLGGGLLESAQGNSNQLLLVTGVALEIVNALAVFGIGFILFWVLKIFRESAAKIYLILRILESLACFAAPLVLVLDFNHSGLRPFFTGSLIPLFFCSGALVLYTMLYVFRILPRFISIWGFIGVLGIIILNLTNIESSAGMLLALPIILNEIFLGIWLIVKGFTKTESLKDFKMPLKVASKC